MLRRIYPQFSQLLSRFNESCKIIFELFCLTVQLYVDSGQMHLNIKIRVRHFKKYLYKRLQNFQKIDTWISLTYKIIV